MFCQKTTTAQCCSASFHERINFVFKNTTSSAKQQQQQLTCFALRRRGDILDFASGCGLAARNGRGACGRCSRRDQVCLCVRMSTMLAQSQAEHWRKKMVFRGAGGAAPAIVPCRMRITHGSSRTRGHSKAAVAARSVSCSERRRSHQLRARRMKCCT